MNIKQDSILAELNRYRDKRIEQAKEECEFAKLTVKVIQDKFGQYPEIKAKSPTYFVIETTHPEWMHRIADLMGTVAVEKINRFTGSNIKWLSVDCGGIDIVSLPVDIEARP